MKAKLKNYRQSPRKVRLVTDLVKGKKLNQAKTLLDFTNKRASQAVKKLILSAEANALSKDGAKPEDLYIENIKVDEGITLKRMRARAMGRGVIIRKRTSNIEVSLANKPEKKTVKNSSKNKKATNTKSEAKKQTKTKAKVKASKDKS